MENAHAKITELIAALHYATDDLKIIGQKVMLNCDFVQVTESMDACKKIASVGNQYPNSYQAFPESISNTIDRRKKQLK